MRINKLLHNCDLFDKFAQQQTQKIVLDPKKKNIEFWGNFLINAIRSYANYLPSPTVAKTIFNDVAATQKGGALVDYRELRNIDMILTALIEAESKLTQAGVNITDFFKSKGMMNINPNMLNVLKSNLETLKEGKDFSKYQHFYLQKPGEAKIIELDDEGSKSPGY